MENQKPRVAKTVLYNKGTSGGITIPGFKFYYRATVLKAAWYWHKNRQEDHWNQIEDPNINPHTYEHLIFFLQRSKNIRWKNKTYSTNGAGKTMSTCRRMKIDPYLSSYTKLKSKWIKDLNINPTTLNLIEEKVGSSFQCMDTGDHFLNITPLA